MVGGEDIYMSNICIDLCIYKIHCLPNPLLHHISLNIISRDRAELIEISVFPAVHRTHSDRSEHREMK